MGSITEPGEFMAHRVYAQYSKSLFMVYTEFILVYSEFMHSILKVYSWFTQSLFMVYTEFMHSILKVYS